MRYRSSFRVGGDLDDLCLLLIRAIAGRIESAGNDLSEILFAGFDVDRAGVLAAIRSPREAEFAKPQLGKAKAALECGVDRGGDLASIDLGAILLGNVNARALAGKALADDLAAAVAIFRLPLI